MLVRDAGGTGISLTEASASPSAIARSMHSIAYAHAYPYPRMSTNTACRRACARTTTCTFTFPRHSEHKFDSMQHVSDLRHLHHTIPRTRDRSAVHTWHICMHTNANAIPSHALKPRGHTHARLYSSHSCLYHTLASHACMHAHMPGAAMLEELGRVLCNVGNVCHEGVIVFFPSYKMADQAWAAWEKTGWRCMSARVRVCVFVCVYSCICLYVPVYGLSGAPIVPTVQGSTYHCHTVDTSLIYH